MPDSLTYLATVTINYREHAHYGVDRNPMAVDLAKLSLWLATLAKDHPFTFLDHAIRPGDSLVGLTRRQIEGFTWQPEIQTLLFAKDVAQRTAAALRERQNLLGMGDDYGTPQLKREKLEKADELLDLVRFIGDAAIAAYFSADKDKAREQKRVELAERIAAYLRTSDLRLRPTAEVIALRGELASSEQSAASGNRAPAADRSPLAAHAVCPFHWEIEFPEVFERENPGFDAFLGNPPFFGGSRVSEEYGMRYFDWLTEAFPPAGHQCDLVAYFFRQAFSLLRKQGCTGLIATNTIAQGDTREGGLCPILTNGGSIYAARTRTKWPGAAAVTVSVVHLQKGSTTAGAELDGQQCPRICAYLMPGDTDAPPDRLAATPYFSAGSKIYGQGFLFDDSDEAANPMELKRALLHEHPNLAERILPYIGGEEINTSPTQAAHRCVIFLSDVLEEQDLNRFSPVAEIVRRRVKPERDMLGDNPNNVALKRRWWAYWAHRPELYRRLSSMSRVLANSQVSSHFAFTFLPTGQIYAHTANLFAVDSFAAFGTAQSRVHETWTRFFASSLEDRLRYTPSDCFETFPFPAGWETNAALEAAGREYYEFRAALMVRNNEGLTKTYNRFHDPQERSPDIQTLRDLHARMDAAVLAAYGWTDLPTVCDFILDYEEDEAEEPTGRKRKKPWRYRWPDETRDEVLARLLKLNAERAQKERLAGMAAAAAAPAKRRRGERGKGRGGAASTQGDLLPPPQPDLFP